MIKVNKVDINDLDRLHKIDLDNFHDAWSKDMMKSELENEYGEYYGLFNDNDLIGFCGGIYIEGEYQLNKVVVDKEYRNKKLGQIFFTYVMQLYKLKGAKKANLEVRVSNMPAVTVYEKAGFITLSVRKNYYKDNGENAFVMVRDFRNEE